MNLADEKGLGQESFNTLVETGFMVDIFDAAVNGSLREVDRERFRQMIGLDPLELQITVNYNLSLAEMISAGKYDWISDDINEDNFPVRGTGIIESVVELIHFNRNISSDDAEKELKKMKLRPANVEEILAFGAEYPETQRKFPIIALGSVASVSGNREVVYLGRLGAARDLRLLWRGHVWSARCRFLAVRN